jgi:hypothetical protein
MNAIITTIANIKAVVEKLAGNINANVIKTGTHSSNTDALKVIGSSLVFDK